MTTITKLDNLDKLDIYELLIDQDYCEFNEYFFNEYYENYDEDDEITPMIKIEIINKWIKDEFNNNMMKLKSYLKEYGWE